MSQLILGRYSKKYPFIRDDLVRNVHDTTVSLLSTVRIIPQETQGIPPFHIYTTRNYKSNISGSNTYRFDWIELIDRENIDAFNGIYAQVCAVCLL